MDGEKDIWKLLGKEIEKEERQIRQTAKKLGIVASKVRTSGFWIITDKKGNRLADCALTPAGARFWLALHGESISRKKGEL